MALTALDFPASPTVGQRHPDPPVTGQPQYTWNGSQWISSKAAVTQIARTDALGWSGMQINGSMEVSQEKGTSGTTVPGTYAVDGWMLNYNGTMAVSLGQYTGQLAASSFDCILAGVINTAQPTLTGSHYVMVRQLIEGYRVARLGWGTARAQPITLGFWTAHSVTGAYSGSVRNGASDRSYVFTYTQNVAGTYEFKTITIPGDTTGTWLLTNGIGLVLTFAMACGPTLSNATTGAWLAGSYIASTSQTNLAATINNVFRITGVVVLPGIEVPTAAQSPLIMRPYDQEVVTCQRYYAKSFASGTTPANNTPGVQFIGAVYAGTALLVNRIPFPVQMRGFPTIAFYSPASGTPVNGQWQYFNGTSYINSGTTVNALSPLTESGFGVNMTTAASTIGQSFFTSGHWTADARL